MMNLIDLAQQLDGLDPEKNWQQRLDLAEQMKARLGDRFAAFERHHDDLVLGGCAQPATQALRDMQAAQKEHP